MMLPVQLAMPLALMVGAAIAATTPPSRHGDWEADTGPGDGPNSDRATDRHGDMRMLRLSLQPGASLPWHRDAIPGTGYVLEGELHMRTSGTAKVMRTGDCLLPSMAAEGSTVAGPQGATVLVFYAERHATRS
ncbi:hypothetical protein [Luteibacter sp. UNCMF366Tsu5.1]|uniref:hypothetical protein n=1 Tax=Luteibacter sp. UNCMF366Tsu5.1 TaxID=1502758 RepID=UPI0009090D23|nr:hypothetical protein [Luteibacter sp. UNCMF366Tsu5.1]SFW38943.1 hypothetical protein SAMN02800691_1492 [Luteibacter sp. UNCMF366Tsu5.1]